MKDIGGSIIFSASEDAEFDCKMLVKLLNEFEWCESFGKWMLCENFDENNEIYFNENYTKSPTVDPIKEIKYGVIIDSDAEEIYVSEEQYEKDNMEGYFTGMYEERYDLGEVVNKIYPCIKKGWIEIACIGQYINENMEFSKLQIRADGSGKRWYISSGMISGSQDFIEEFEVNKR